MTTLARFNLVNVAPALYLFILPFAHTTAIRSTAFGLTLLCAIIVWVRWRAPTVPLKIPLLLWALVALATLPWATDRSFSIAEIKSEIAYGIAIYLAFFALTRTGADIRTFLLAMGAGLFALCLHAWWTFARTYSIEGDNLHGGVLYFVTYIVTVIPVLVGAAIAARDATWVRIAAVALIIAALLTGALGLNRSFLPIVGLSMVLFAMLHLGRGGAASSLQQRRTWLVLAIAAPILVGGFLVTAKFRTVEPVSPAQAVERIWHSDPRFNIWRYSLARIAEHPLTGTGFGRMAQAQKFQAGTGDVQGVHPHNIVLSYGVQAGIPGMLVIVLLFGAIVWQLWRHYRFDDEPIRIVATTGLCVIAAVLLKNMVDDLFVRHNAWLCWALLGMALGYAERRRGAMQ